MEVFDTESVTGDGQISKWSEWRKRYQNASKVITSKAGLITLAWSFAVATIYGILYQPRNYYFLPLDNFNRYSFHLPIFFAASGIIYCFYPLAGFLADNKIGRYKTILRSIQLLFGCFIIGGVLTLPFLFLTLDIVNNNTTLTFVGPIGLLVSLFLILFPMTVGFVGFNANVVQFGMDQLHDSPTDHQSLFIHWYVWVYYLAEFISSLPWELIPASYIATFVLILLMIVTMALLCVIFLIVAHYRKHWFLIDSARVNPYRLVYKITKFAQRHKVPLHRSAFTYCEEELPTGLDLGKTKYGGPFTTEEVEDVKAFYGILKVLFALGPVFFLSFGVDPTLYWYARHLNTNFQNHSVWSNISNPSTFGALLSNNFFNPLAIVIFLLVYLFILRPFRMVVLPKMLTRIGIGIIFLIVSQLCVFVLVTESYHHGTNNCIFNYTTHFDNNNFMLNTGVLFVQCCTFPLSNVLIYTALFEFICAQSPHSMKGLLIGLSFAIKGFFQVLAAIMVIPFIYIDFHSLSCGIFYYLMNIIMAPVIFLVYVWVARKYNHRQREDFCDIYRYAEEYYSKLH